MEEPFLTLGRVSTLAYFVYFFLIVIAGYIDKVFVTLIKHTSNKNGTKSDFRFIIYITIILLISFITGYWLIEEFNNTENIGSMDDDLDTKDTYDFRHFMKVAAAALIGLFLLHLFLVFSGWM